MKNKVCKYLLIATTIFLVVIGLIGIKSFQNEKISSTDMIIKAFDSSGAKLVYGETYVWGSLDATYKDLDELSLFARKFSEQIGMDKNSIVIKHEQNDYVNNLEINGISNAGEKITAKFQMSPNENDKKTVTICVAEDLNTKQLCQTTENIKKVFQKNNIKSKESSCLVGSFDGDLSSVKVEDIRNKIFNASQAVRVEGVKDNKYSSVSAYSPLVSNYIRVNGNKVNMNLAIRYNSYEKKTYIWVATPVIKIEY